MNTAAIAIEIFTYATALWMGFYLLGRDFSKPRLRLTGLGLLAYALALGSDVLLAFGEGMELAWLGRVQRLLLFLPAVLWAGAIIHLLPEDNPWRDRMARAWASGVLPFVGGMLALVTLTRLESELAYLLLASLLLLPLLNGLRLVVVASQSSPEKLSYGILLLTTLFIGLEVGLLLFPLDWVPHYWLLIAIGVDFEILALVLAYLDALEEGESLRADMLRSFQGAFLLALLFGSQVLLVMYMGEGVNFWMMALLLSTLGAAVFVQTFSLPLQSWLDLIAFRNAPQLLRARAELQGAAVSLPRLNMEISLDKMEEDEFARLTRRALSHFGDLPRLARSPLTRLGLIDTRLEDNQGQSGTLARAAELKKVLAESISRLKPQNQGNFGATDEWRFYNALYFPYVIGLKPYRRNPQGVLLDQAALQALEWFQREVPERTLHNWQNAAAKLIAQDLRETG